MLVQTFLIQKENILKNVDIVQKLPYGESIIKKSLVYSFSMGYLFCAIYKLFGGNNQFGCEGFNYWKNGYERITGHENSYEHKKT